MKGLTFFTLVLVVVDELVVDPTVAEEELELELELFVGFPGVVGTVADPLFVFPPDDVSFLETLTTLYFGTVIVYVPSSFF